jgi:hypothetical protein
MVDKLTKLSARGRKREIKEIEKGETKIDKQCEVKKRER